MSRQIKVTVTIPDELHHFENRELDLEQIGTIKCYLDNVSKKMLNESFNAGDFYGITFYYAVDSRPELSVFALPKDLKSGPEFRINANNHKSLKEIVRQHLEQHPELNLTLADFS